MDNQDTNTDTNSLDFKPGRPKIGRKTVALFGEVLRRERKYRGMTGERMVELLDQAGCKMSPPTLYNIERSLVQPTLEQARIIGSVYGLKLSEFVQPEREATGSESVDEKMFEKVLEDLRAQIRATMLEGGAQ